MINDRDVCLLDSDSKKARNTVIDIQQENTLYCASQHRCLQCQPGHNCILLEFIYDINIGE
jgi:hypothetical protein